METTADNQNAKLKEIAMEMKKVDLVLEKTKGIKKLNQDICQTSLTMAGVLKKIEGSSVAQAGNKENCKQLTFEFLCHVLVPINRVRKPIHRYRHCIIIGYVSHFKPAQMGKDILN